MAMSRAHYATGNAERVAQRARSFVRNELKTGKPVTKDQLTELAKLLGAIELDWRVPRAIRDRLRAGVWAEFKIDRQPAILMTTRHAADRKTRLGL